MVGLTNALEQDGFISGFMGFYIKMVTLDRLAGGFASRRSSRFDRLIRASLT